MTTASQRQALTGLAIGGIALAILAASGSSASAAPARKAEPQTPPAPDVPPSPAPSKEAEQAGPVTPLSQIEIVNAIEASIVGGDITPLAAIVRTLQRQPGPIQAYVAAAGRRAKAYHADIAAYIKDFGVKEKEIAKKLASDEAAAYGVVGAVAVAANQIPVVGQVISAVIGVGIAISKAIQEGFKLPVRKAEDQIRPAYEGLQTFLGLGVTAPENPYEQPYLVLKQAVVQDPVAFALPTVPARTAFIWAPKLADFQEAAHELGLYEGDR